MDIFEATEAYPSRTAQQEEEEQKQASASLNLHAPLLLWNEALKQQLYPQGVTPTCLVVATSKVSCSLINSSFPSKQVLGTCILPEVQMRGVHVQSSLQDRTCFIYSCGDQGQLLLACCQYDVRPERARAFAKNLLHGLQSQHVLILGSLASEGLRSGDIDPSQEPLVYLLSSSASKQPGQQPVPYLPSGSIASGLPAALLSDCQARGVSAELLVCVDMVPSLLPMALQPLATAAGTLIARRAGGSGLVQAAAQELISAICLKAASAQLQHSYGSAMLSSDAVFS